MQCPSLKLETCLLGVSGSRSEWGGTWGCARCVLHTAGYEEAGAEALRGCKLEVSLLGALVLAGDVSYLAVHWKSSVALGR